MVPGRLDKPEDLAPGDGAVQQVGKDKVAVYKDEDGKAHTFAAACPHLGCLVQWNPVDGTFGARSHSQASVGMSVVMCVCVKAGRESLYLYWQYMSLAVFCFYWQCMLLVVCEWLMWCTGRYRRICGKRRLGQLVLFCYASEVYFIFH